MPEKIVFQPVRCTQAKLDAITTIHEGYIYYAYDSGRIYLDKDGARYLISTKSGGGGGGGTGIIYANGSNTQIIPVDLSEREPVQFRMELAAIENQILPEIDNLILNSDGRFFRVLGTDPDDETKILVKLLAVSGGGSGGGGGGSSVERDVNITWDTNTISTGHTYIYGQNFNAVFTPSTTVEGDTKCNVTFNIIDLEHDTVTVIVRNGVPNNQPLNFNMNQLPESSNITLKVIVTSDGSQYNYGMGYERNITNLRVVTMGIKKVSDKYIPLIDWETTGGGLELQYIPLGDRNITETLHIYIDNEELRTQAIDPSWYGRDVTITIPRQGHGTHIIDLKISTDINGETIYTEPITFEAAWTAKDIDDPVIWIGKYDTLVINYENSYINYMVYDPISIKQGLSAPVQLYKNGIIVSELSLEYSTTNWLSWDISSIYEVGQNIFSIICRGARKDVIVNVTEEGSRDLSLAKKDSLLENFTAAGRSSLEVKSSRGVWKDLINQTPANLINFNWQNNGWKKDTVVGDAVDSGTYLSVANGAQLSFPMPSLRLNFDRDYTIEARFRIRNVQKYSTLITTLPKYFYEVQDENTGAVVKSSTSETMDWINSNNKRVWYDEYGSPLMDEENVEKTYETTTGVICKWMNDSNYGLVLGSQEAYFRSSRGIISVRYKEDEVINISCVISKTDGLVYLYLNGILSGADSLPPAGQTGQFTINSPFTFNSEYCDVDLYRFRVFQSGLSMPDVIHNYLSDMHSIKLYDQNQLTDALDPTQLSYELLVRYNQEHPDELTMPYSVWKIKDGERQEKLPYFKGDGCKVDITFVNPTADKYLEEGLITPWVYYGNSPSFFATDVDIDVQGTSSQGYPRRNYKTKYKKATSWIYTQGPLAGESVTNDYAFFKGSGELVTIEQLDEETGEIVVVPMPVDDERYNSSTMQKLVSKFHMDNQDIGVNKFTWKIDYMESSGSYNTGFANLLGNLQYPLYTKHPLEDLGLSGAGLRTTVYGYPVLTFHEYTDYNNNVSNPGVRYEYIGRYNMNLDKSANEAYGYESKTKNPYNDKTIKSIAECWELSDNQGTWCSFKFPDAAAREIGFGTAQEGSPNRLEMIRHFEYRYSAYGDQIDAIGADGGYDGKTTDAAIIAEIGTNDAQKSAYLRDKYINLEKLFFWLDSTDTTNVPVEDQDIYIREPVKNQEGIITISKTKIDSVSYHTSTDYTGKLGATSVPIGSGGYETTFTKDIAEYRLEKFRNEFDKHLDLEYCLVYFVLTELLLCYDSRGKNMMIATWGPHEEGGDYIWYPTFYDIDTQLGLNNSGSYLWDYDADVTLDGLFSTPGSVLWTNLFTMFNDEIKNKYKAFRGADDGSSVKNNLTYEKITGAYECNPTVFGSYAMMGIRPVIAIGLDEYYKYFATTKTGYFDTKGILIIQDTPTFAYCCQGDKKLTTELLLRNRLNYIDSWWMGGDYEITKVKQGQFWGRINGNRQDLTSDKFLNVEQNIITNNPSIYAGFKSSNGIFPIPHIDSVPDYNLTPFLKQYVNFYIDEVPQLSQKYTATVEEQANGVKVVGIASIRNPYATDTNMAQQLSYLPGVDYLSSMGDLSTQYFDEFHLTAGKRLLDLIVGSDVPGYENGLLGTNNGFDLGNGLGSNTPKSLMKKVVLTQMTAFDKTVPMQGSEKLEEFRALGTKLKGVYFAKGAPLHTVHLPKSLTGLELSETKELTNLLTTRPTIAKWVDKETRQEVAYNNITNFNDVEVEYADPATYRGLYLERITDYNNTYANTGHVLSTLVIEGGGLGYGSYQILDNLIKLKKDFHPTGNAEENNTLAVSLKEVAWTPYTAVESGEIYDENETYYKLNDHSMFDPYVFTNTDDWNRDTLNSLIYTYDSTVNKDIITDTSLLDFLIEQYEDAKGGDTFSQFANTAGLSTATIPTITGTMFIANRNGEAIPESDLTGKYASKEYFPNLQIQAENVRKANVTKYVRMLDTGVEELIEQPLRSDSVHPLGPTAQPPARAGYDFVGWTLDAAGTQMFLPYHIDYNTGLGEYDNEEYYLSQYTFDAEHSVLTLYAQFKVHQNVITIYSNNQKIGAALIDNGASFTNPTYIYDIVNDLIDDTTGHAYMPYKSDSNLAFDQVYKFIGYSTDATCRWHYDDYGVPVIESPPPEIIKKDISIYSIFDAVDVHQNVLTDTSYYEVQQVEINGEVYNSLQLIRPNDIQGKVTLPKSVNGQTIHCFNQVTSGSNTSNTITHIFWEEGSSLQFIGTYACDRWPNLVYFELPNNNTTIGQNAFFNCKLLFKDVSQTILNAWFTKIKVLEYASLSGISSDYTKAATDIQQLIGKTIQLSNIEIINNNALQGIVCEGIMFGSSSNLDFSYNNLGNSILTNTCSQGAGTSSKRKGIDLIFYDASGNDYATIESEVNSRLNCNITPKSFVIYQV